MTQKRIVALQGATNREIQAMLGSFALRSMNRGVRVAGVVEIANPAARSVCGAFVLRDVVSAESFPIYQDLGPSSTACRLDARGVIAACEAVCRQVRAGCDLVVLSKFGKLEAARTGLTAAFAAAVGADLPIVTAVAPAFANEWHRFSAPLASVMAPSEAMLDHWWQGLDEQRDAPPATAGHAA